MKPQQHHASLAQLVERFSRKEKVSSSILLGGSGHTSDLIPVGVIGNTLVSGTKI